MEIRMLGPLQVRRGDGTVVEDQEWRTTKTVDLLRLLALHNGESVAARTIVALLWPDVEESRGRASLRTAASQLRKALGSDCVVRTPSGLVLQGVWCDTQDYETLLSEAAASRQLRDHASTVARVQQAESLWVGDLDLPDQPADWLHEAWERLRRLRCRALLHAAEAAASLRWMRDSLELAERAAALDPGEETARALMRALAGVGDLGKALEVFDRTRQDLARRYGVDPSPQTRALHLQLLTGTMARVDEVDLVGHELTVLALAEELSALRRDGSGGGVVWLQGEAGSGRDSVAAAACAAAGLTMRDVGRDAWLHDRYGVPVTLAEVGECDVVLMPRAGTVPGHALKVIDTLAGQHKGVLVVPVLHSPDRLDALGVPHRVVHVEPLTDPELHALAEVVLQGRPTERLVEHLKGESHGFSGTACRIARDWLAEGRVVWSVDGLELADSAVGHLRGSSTRLRRLLRTLSPFAEDLVNVLAVADSEVAADEVVTAASSLHPAAGCAEVRAALHQLVEAGHVVMTCGGHRLREPAMNAEIVAWMRPNLRRRLCALVAQHVSLPVSDQVRLLIAAADPHRAAEVGHAGLRLAEAEGGLDHTASLRRLLAEIPVQQRRALVGAGRRGWDLTLVADHPFPSEASAAQ